MITPIEMIPKMVIPVQYAMALYLHPLFHLTNRAISLPSFVKLKDSDNNILGHAYHSLLPMIPIHLDHAFNQTPDICLHKALIEGLNMMSLTILE
jgi:hypothetical protein